jgi:uncharacterized protein with HEPN domain
MRERKRDKSRLEDILKCIDNVRQFVRDIDFDTFVADTMRYYAVMKNVEIIGEAANMLTRNFRKNYDDLPWRMIVSMRNVLTHGYANVSDVKLWKTATEDLEPMYETVSRYLSEINWNEWEQGEDDYSEIDSDAYKQAVETAQRLKAMAKLSDEQIAQATGLTIKEVEELS